jgi:hypothetical protein
MSTPLDHLNGALDAAINLANHASLALEKQRGGNGLSPAAYRKRIQAIKALTWCAINDLGQAKRVSVRGNQIGKK